DRLGFYVLDVVHTGGESALVECDDAPRHAVGGKTRIAEDDTDDRNVDVRKNVGWRAQRRRDTEDHDQERHHDECVWTPKREPHNAGHDFLRSLSELTRSQPP